MKFIDESLIEAAAEAVGGAEEKEQEQMVESLRQAQPALLAYFFTEGFQVFTQSEKEYMLYLLLVLWKAIELSGEEAPEVTAEQLSEAEDENWAKMQESKSKQFHEKLNPFFEQCPQEDLLAFVEDALAEDEEEETEMVSREGREAIFISLKSAIDCLAGA